MEGAPIMPKLSIIIPVYNAEPYIKRCMDSVLCQTFSDFELIIVNDGSADDSARIADEYAGEDYRIIVIHQGNQGVSSARNTGLEIAAGEYIAFVDSDDEIKPNMYQALLDGSNNADVVMCGKVIMNTSLPQDSLYDLPIHVEGVENVRKGLLSKFYNSSFYPLVSCWGKLYRRKLLQDHAISFNKDLSSTE